MTTQTLNQYMFEARMDHIKPLISGIKALNFCENAFVHVSDEGMRITVEKGKSVQGSLFITKVCFHEYKVEGVICFGLNINVLYECLTIFGNTECCIKLYYKDRGAPLLFRMYPLGGLNVTTEVSIKTAHYEDPMDFNLDENEVTHNSVFFRGSDFFSLISEIDKSAEELELSLAPVAPYFKLKIIGVMQSETNISVSKTSAMMLLFNCRGTTRARYKCTHVRLVTKALSAASKVALKTDKSGLLEMHLMLQSEAEEAEIYIQFYIAPQADID